MGSDKEFDWSDLNDEDVIQKTVGGIAVYENPNGDVVIRQQATDIYDDGDSWVVIPVERIPALITKLQSHLPD